MKKRFQLEFQKDARLCDITIIADEKSINRLERSLIKDPEVTYYDIKEIKQKAVEWKQNPTLNY